MRRIQSLLSLMTVSCFTFPYKVSSSIQVCWFDENKTKEAGKTWRKAWTRIKSEAERAALGWRQRSVACRKANQQANQALRSPKMINGKRNSKTDFPFSETKDQQKAIDHVKEDMESEEPMDRLICGDVSFKKTESYNSCRLQVRHGWKQVNVIGSYNDSLPTDT